MRAVPAVIRFDTLEPSWAVKRATEPGFHRWLVSWMGGPDGTVNFNPGQAAPSRRAAMGFMAMPQGNRQAGVHVHSVAEIYVILKGEIEGFDHTGAPHRAGPFDCIYIPAGVPHGVRSVGCQDLHLVWVHDAIERLGVSQYLDAAAPDATPERIRIVSLPNGVLTADAGGPDGSRVGYVGDGAGEVPNAGIRLGLHSLPSGAAERFEAGSGACAGSEVGASILINAGGAAVVRLADRSETLGYLDAVHLPPGTGATIWNSRDAPVRLLRLDERPD